MRLYAYSGWLLFTIGVIHTAIGVIMGWDILSGIVGDGGWNSIESNGEIDFARSAIVWFLLVGFFWLLLGYLMQCWLRNSPLPLPQAVGWGLLSAGAMVAFLLPMSGAWLFLPLGILVLRGRPRQLAQ